MIGDWEISVPFLMPMDSGQRKGSIIMARKTVTGEAGPKVSKPKDVELLAIARIGKVLEGLSPGSGQAVMRYWLERSNREWCGDAKLDRSPSMVESLGRGLESRLKLAQMAE